MPVNIEIYKKSREHDKLLDRFVKESKKKEKNTKNITFSTLKLVHQSKQPVTFDQKYI
jgi:hypothetical protein